MKTTSATKLDSGLIAPHGGELVDLISDSARCQELEDEAKHLRRWTLSARQLCDIEQLITGAFSPLKGFMNRADYKSVRDDMRLADGTLWPMPIVLDMPLDETESMGSGDRIALMHPENVLIAVLTVGDIWQPDRMEEASKVFGSTDSGHPGVNSVLNGMNPVYVGGDLEAVRASQHHTYRSLRHTPFQLREEFERRGWDRIVAFQTRNPLHRAHVELTRRAAEEADAKLLIHPVVGLTKPGDVEYHTRVRCYRGVIDDYPANSAMLSLLQLAMRMGGPREAVWHSIVRKNYGCSHLIIGRDHAGPGSDANGNPYYGPYDAQHLVSEYRDELSIEAVTFQEIVYERTTGRYMTRAEMPDGGEEANISGTELRERLQSGAELPEWFSFPAVIEELRKSYPPMDKRGFNVIIAGSSDSDKSVLAKVIEEKLLEDGTRPVTMLDASISADVAYLVAREVTRNGGAVITILDESTDLDQNDAESLDGMLLRVHLSGSSDSEDVASALHDDSDANLTLPAGSMSPDELGDAVMGRLIQWGLITY